MNNEPVRFLPHQTLFTGSGFPKEDHERNTHVCFDDHVCRIIEQIPDHNDRSVMARVAIDAKKAAFYQEETKMWKFYTYTLAVVAFVYGLIRLLITS